MKYLMLLLLLIPLMGYSQTEDSVSQWVKDTDYMMESLAGRLENFAKTLEGPAEHVYKSIYKQQYVKAITSLLGSGVFITLFVYFLQVAKRNYKRGSLDSGAVIVLPIAFATLFALIGFVWLGSDMDIIVTGILNPDYGAIREITKILK